MCTEKTPWEQVIDFHGHTCAEIALGFRVAQIAQRELGIRPAPTSELIAESEVLSCAIDAIQIVNRCPVGRGALIIHDKHNYVFRFHYTGTDTVLNISIDSAILELLKSIEELESPRQRQNKMLETIQMIFSIEENKFCTIEQTAGALQKRV